MPLPGAAAPPTPATAGQESSRTGGGHIPSTSKRHHRHAQRERRHRGRSPSPDSRSRSASTTSTSSSSSSSSSSRTAARSPERHGRSSRAHRHRHGRTRHRHHGADSRRERSSYEHGGPSGWLPYGMAPGVMPGPYTWPYAAMGAGPMLSPLAAAHMFAAHGAGSSGTSDVGSTAAASTPSAPAMPAGLSVGVPLSPSAGAAPGMHPLMMAGGWPAMYPGGLWAAPGMHPGLMPAMPMHGHGGGVADAAAMVQAQLVQLQATQAHLAAMAAQLQGEVGSAMEGRGAPTTPGSAQLAGEGT